MTETASPEEIAHWPPDRLRRWLDTGPDPFGGAAALERDPEEGTTALFFGDTHGDWRSTKAVVRRWRSFGPDALLIGLGDYVDRPLPDCPGGSVVNFVYLAELARVAPERVVLLAGNHETARAVPVAPHNLPDELSEFWGLGPDSYERFLDRLDRLPLGLRVGPIYGAHAGVPRRGLEEGWAHAGERARRDPEALAEFVWTDPAEARALHGVTRPLEAAELEAFLRQLGARYMLRGHNPELTGRWTSGGRALTLHTTRLYRRFGGPLVAVVRFGPKPRITLERLEEDLGIPAGAGS